MKSLKNAGNPAGPYELPLGDGWSFFEAKSKRWLPAVVPGCVHLDLLRNGLIKDPFWGSNEMELQWIEHEDWKYRATFSVPAEALAYAADCGPSSRVATTFGRSASSDLEK